MNRRGFLTGVSACGAAMASPAALSVAASQSLGPMDALVRFIEAETSYLLALHHAKFGDAEAQNTIAALAAEYMDASREWCRSVA